MTFDEKLQVAKAYPDETEGSRLVAEARRLSNPLSHEERRRLFREAIHEVSAGRQPRGVLQAAPEVLRFDNVC